MKQRSERGRDSEKIKGVTVGSERRGRSEGEWLVTDQLTSSANTISRKVLCAKLCYLSWLRNCLAVSSRVMCM